MKLELIHKLLFGIFFLFLIFSAIVIFVGDYLNDPLIATVLFIAVLYAVYYMAVKFLLKD